MGAVPAGADGALQEAVAMLRPGGWLYVVLPLACVENSRYVTLETLLAVLGQLGLKQLEVRTSAKLVYLLHTFDPSHAPPPPPPRKRRAAIRSGPDRNNFCIQL